MKIADNRNYKFLYHGRLFGLGKDFFDFYLEVVVTDFEIFGESFMEGMDGWRRREMREDWMEIWGVKGEGIDLVLRRTMGVEGWLRGVAGYLDIIDEYFLIKLVYENWVA